MVATKELSLMTIDNRKLRSSSITLKHTTVHDLNKKLYII